MKTIITATGDSLNAEFDLRFGRANWFCVYDPEDGSTEFIRNTAADSTGGAGTAAAQTVAQHDVKKVISGDFGPKAQQILERLGIQMVVLENEQSTVAKIIERIR